MTPAEGILCAAVLLLSLACVVLGTILLRRRRPEHWWLDATLIRDERLHNSGQHIRHYQLSVELKPGQEPK